MNKCSTYIARLFYEAGINYNKPKLFETPKNVFDMLDAEEQVIYLENLHGHVNN